MTTRAKRRAVGTGGGINSSRMMRKGEKSEMKKSILSLALVLALVVSLFAGLAVTANAADVSFPDLKATHWAYDKIMYCVENGILKGDDAGTVRPDDPIKRAEVAAVLDRTFNAAEIKNVKFPDVTKGWYVDEVLSAAGKGLFDGYENGTFRPETLITRQEAMKVIAKLLGVEGEAADLKGFKDAGKVDKWAEKYVAGLVKTEVIDGYENGTLRPQNNITRAEFAKIMCIILKGLEYESNGDGTHTATLPSGLYRTLLCELVEGVCPVCGYLYAKFELSVASGSAVTATAYSDYSAVLSITGKNGAFCVNADSATVSAKMTDVASLGVAGTREHSVKVDTGIKNTQADLKEWLGNVFAFKGATVKGTIDGKPYAYTLSNFDAKTNTITATTDYADTQAAWQALTANVSTKTQETDDSYIVIANGSSLKVGNELLCFEENYRDALKLDNFNDMSALNETIRKAVTLKTDAKGDDVVAVLKAGTTLAVGQSIAVLDKDVTVTVSGLKDLPAGMLEGLREAANAENATYQVIRQLVQCVNTVVGAMNEQTVTVNFAFAE